MKKNFVLRLGVLALVLTLITMPLVSGTYAKYVTQAEGTATARVAKWGVNVSVDADDLFGYAYWANQYPGDPEPEDFLADQKATWVNPLTSSDYTGITVNASTNDSFVLAPGTKGSLTFSITGTPEVAVKVEVLPGLNNAGEQLDSIVTFSDNWKVPGYTQGSLGGKLYYDEDENLIMVDYKPIRFSLETDGLYAIVLMSRDSILQDPLGEGEEEQSQQGDQISLVWEKDPSGLSYYFTYDMLDFVFEQLGKDFLPPNFDLSKLIEGTDAQSSELMQDEDFPPEGSEPEEPPESQEEENNEEATIYYGNGTYTLTWEWPFDGEAANQGPRLNESDMGQADGGSDGGNMLGSGGSLNGGLNLAEGGTIRGDGGLSTGDGRLTIGDDLDGGSSGLRINPARRTVNSSDLTYDEADTYLGNQAATGEEALNITFNLRVVVTQID